MLRPFKAAYAAPRCISAWPGEAGRSTVLPRLGLSEALCLCLLSNPPAWRPPRPRTRLSTSVLLSAVKTAAAKGGLGAGSAVGQLVAAPQGPQSETKDELGPCPSSVCVSWRLGGQAESALLSGQVLVSSRTPAQRLLRQLGEGANTAGHCLPLGVEAHPPRGKDGRSPGHNWLPHPRPLPAL